MKDVYILSGARTAQGSFLGALANTSAPKLGAVAIEAAVAKAGLDKKSVEEVLMGQVVQAGAGQAPARQAAIFAGLEKSTRAVTINKVCGSGMQTVIQGAQSIMLGDRNIIVAGGMENMSMAPHLLPSGRAGIKFGEGVVRDAMQWDGLWDVYSNQAMGNCAEVCAKEKNFSREQQDEYAISSFKRAQEAQAKGVFKEQIAPVKIKVRREEVDFAEDEGPQKVKFDKIPSLRPAFDREGTITAANASTINDGACALVLGSQEYKAQAKFKIHSYAGHAEEPTWFTTAPVGAVHKNLERAGLKLEDIGVWEVNEAFAVVALNAIHDLKLNREDVNIYGGAISLGHPIGVSGSRIILSLMSAMQERKVQYGCASICIGGGEALSIILEQL